MIDFVVNQITDNRFAIKIKKSKKKSMVFSLFHYYANLAWRNMSPDSKKKNFKDNEQSQRHFFSYTEFLLIVVVVMLIL